MKKKSIKQKQKTASKAKLPQVRDTPSWHIILIALSAFLLYANTFSNGYAQDDSIVITENMYTQKGISGIPGLLTKDTFFGFFKVEGKENLVAGGRYRPLTPVTFAIEQQIFGNSATIRHIINTLLYVLLSVVLYRFVRIAFARHLPAPRISLFALIAIMIFVFHPIHTEAVTNIKGRDEIMAMMLGFGAVNLMLKPGKSNLRTSIYAGLLFFLALMSKENAITLIPVAFLASYLLLQQTFRESLKPTIPLITGAILFILIRIAVIGISIGDPPLEMMNNPFVKFENGAYAFFTLPEKIAAIIFAMGWYIKLLFIPFPLTNDYYPRQVEVMELSHSMVLVSLLLLVGMIAAGIMYWKRKRVVSFSVFYFILTISIFANIFFPIGTHLSERFLFMPSLGFCLLLAYVLWNIYYKFGLYVFGGIGIALAGVYGFITLDRNPEWKDDYTLYTADVEKSSNSAKALNAAGGVLVKKSMEEKDPSAKNKMLNKALGYLDRAVDIHPHYKNAWLLTGNARFYQNDFDGAIAAYDRALSIDPGYSDALGNLGRVLREAGRYAGEKTKDLNKARGYLQRSIQINSNDPETVRLLGITESLSGNHQAAVEYYQRLVTMSPEVVGGYVLLSQTYTLLGDLENAQLYRNKALQLDPNAFRK